MARANEEEKVMKTLRFLFSLQDPEIFALMALRGFTVEDRGEGWTFVDRAGGRDRDIVVVTKAEVDPRGLDFVDGWENIWVDVADAGLLRKFPKVHEKVFLNIKKTSGLPVLLNVQTFVQRIEALAQSEDEDERAAFALLERRGLNESCRAEVMEQIERLKTETHEPLVTPDPEAEEKRKQAIDEMWAWYRDWAKTARTVVRSKRLRIKMGLSQPRKPEPTVEESEAPVEG